MMEIKDRKIIFLGTPDIAATFLKGLINASFNVVGVITKEDKIRERGHRLTPSAVSIIASEFNIPVFKPHNLNEDYKFIKDLKPDLLLTLAYGQIISADILSLSRYKPLNIHASLLPKYRGASPIQTAIRNGDKETGISLMEMIAELDAGNIYYQEKLPIDDEDNYTSLSDKLAKLAIDIAKKALPLYFEDKLKGVKQDGDISFCKTIKKDEEHLDLNLNCFAFINQIRSLSFTPGGYLYQDENILKIYKATYLNDLVEKETGTIIKAKKDKLILQLKDGQINLDLLQRPTKRMMNCIDFNNGVKDFKGTILH